MQQSLIERLSQSDDVVCQLVRDVERVASRTSKRFSECHLLVVGAADQSPLLLKRRLRDADIVQADDDLIHETSECIRDRVRREEDVPRRQEGDRLSRQPGAGRPHQSSHLTLRHDREVRPGEAAAGAP